MGKSRPILPKTSQDPPLFANPKRSVAEAAPSESIVSLSRRLDIALSGLDAVSRIADADAYMGMSREEAMARIWRLSKNAKDQATEGRV